jgi:hypothetical protein
MQALGSTFAGQRYVSDVLENLLDARDTRQAVRAYCLGLLDGAEDSLRVQLEPIAEYVGGKCMGYPAIWFLERLLGHDPAAIVERCRSPLCVSLSTSIVDDLADDDEELGPAFLAYLYILIGEAAFAGGPDAAMREHLHRALELCLNTRAATPFAATVRRGDRIGAFFAMIAAKAVEDRLEPHRAAVALEATTRFGEICAHIDDWMDAERDLERGALENVSLTLLAERLDGAAPKSLDLTLHAAWLQDQMCSLLEARIEYTMALLNPAGFGDASLALARLLRRTQDSSRPM